MALTPFNKHTYQFAAEPVHSANLNEIQDAILELQEQWTDPDDVDTLGSIVAAVKGMISDAYSSSSTYKVGQLCIHDNTLYKCTTAITAAEEWTPAHWTVTNIAAEIENRVLPGTTVSATSGNIVTINDSRITTDHVLARAEFASSSNITALTRWSTDTAGQFTITGTCSAATTVDILLVKKS